jgi:uncharacterized membrane protein
MAGGLVVASLVWPVVLSAAVVAKTRGVASGPARIVYAAASLVCHQRADRSFHTDGVTWPVCGRCAGLYASAPVGAIFAWRLRRRLSVSAARLIGIAAGPTILTLAVEWSGIDPLSNTVRALTALPLGAAIAAVIVREAAAGTAPKSSGFALSAPPREP